MKKIKGSSIKLSGEVNIASKEVVLKGKKSKTWEDLKEPYKDNSKDFEKLLPRLLGGLAVTAGVPSEKDKLILKFMGGLAVCAGVNITKNPNGSYSVSYMNALNRVRNNAKPVTEELNEEQLKQEIYKIISEMLEKGGPAFASWNALLKDLMKNHGMEDFLKGARAALCAMTGDPVNANTGNFIYSKEDLKILSRIPLSFTRFYNSKEEKVGVFGKGWRHSYEISVEREKNGYILHLADGQDEAYLLDDEGRIVSVFDDFNRLQKTKDGFEYKSGTGLLYTFNKEGRLLYMERGDGVKVLLSYDTEGRLLSVSDKAGNSLNFSYDEQGKLREVKDHTGRKIEYGYESTQLTRVYSNGQRMYDYFYEKNLLVKIRNPRGVYVLENLYDGADRVKIQRFANGGIIRYEYDSEESKTFVTNQNENVEVHIHDESFRNIESEYAGESESFTYDERNLLTSYSDKKGNTTLYEYDKDAMGNIIKETDSMGHETIYKYSLGGKLISVLDAMGNRTEYGYDKAGRITTVCRHEGDKELLTSIKFDKAYEEEKLETDNIPRLIRYKRDLMGDIVSVTNALGDEETFSYDLLGRPVGKKDGQGYYTTYSYTQAGDIKSILYGDGSGVEYTYNSLRQLIQIKDALGTIEIESDKFGRATKVVDYQG